MDNAVARPVSDVEHASCFEGRTRTVCMIGPASDSVAVTVGASHHLVEIATSYSDGLKNTAARGGAVIVTE